MAINLNNNFPFYITPFPGGAYPHNNTSFVSLGNVDATSEFIEFIGEVFVPNGSNGIISNSNGSLIFSLNSATFSNVGTTLRIGIQDVDASGTGDGTFDVYTDLVGGSHTFSVFDLNTVNITNGSKTLIDKQLISIRFEFLSRGGSDALSVTALSYSSLFPYSVFNGTKSVNPLAVCIKFDDGTYGTIQGFYPYKNSAVNVNNTSTPDEYGNIFRVPFNAELVEVVPVVSSINTTDNFDIKIYSNPLTTPTQLYSFSGNPQLIGSTSNGNFIHKLNTPIPIIANTDYVVSFLPTTSNNIQYNIIDFSSGNSDMRSMTQLGTNWSFCSRTNLTGAFVKNDTRLLYMGLGFKNIEEDGIVKGGSYPIV